MLTTRQKADYLMQVVKLRKLMILKDNPAFTYQHSNRKQAISRVHSLQDKIVEAAVDNQVYGNSDSVNHQKTVEQTISEALENDRKRVYKSDDNRYINTAVKLNTEKYSEILNNRLNIESVKLEAKIEEEIRKSKYNGLSEAEIKRKLTEEFKDTAKLRTANIIRDALHTNEVNIGFIHALQNGFQYKVWNNGRGKGKVRAWHRARFISSVRIDEPFDIFGSYHAEMMYPGDLNGGAENVANCRCWLSYTNQKPSNFRSSGSSRSSSSKQTKNTKKNTSNKKSIGSRIKERVSSAIESAKNKVLSRIKETQKRFNSKIKGDIKSNKHSIKNTYNKQLKNYKKDSSRIINNDYDKYTTSDGKRTIEVKEVTPEEFVNNLKTAVKSQLPKDRWRVSVYDVEDYKDCKLYTTKNGSTAAITKDGDIISVCSNNYDGKNHDSIRALLEYCVKQGGNKLDSFDANFEVYRHCGFAPVSYCAFDEEFAPQGWKKDRDKKETIIFFKYMGKESKYESVDDFYKEVEISKDYDQAIKDRELRWDDAI